MSPKIIAIIAVTLLLASAVSLWCTLRQSAPPINHNIYTSLGQVLATEAAAAIHNRGEVVAVIADCSPVSSSVWREQWQAFTVELKKHREVRVSIASSCERVSLAQIAKQHPQAAVIVFFVNPPEWEEFSAAMDGPKIIMFGNPDLTVKDYYSRYFTGNRLAALILTRSLANINQAALPKTPREWFDHYYQLYTPQNFESLPD